MQETKVQTIDMRMIVDLWGWKPFKFIHKPAKGRLGVILVAWNTKVIEVTDFRIGDSSIFVLCKSKEDEVVWA